MKHPIFARFRMPGICSLQKRLIITQHWPALLMLPASWEWYCRSATLKKHPGSFLTQWLSLTQMAEYWVTIASRTYLTGQVIRRSFISRRAIPVLTCGIRPLVVLALAFAGISGSRNVRVLWLCKARIYCCTPQLSAQSLQHRTSIQNYIGNVLCKGMLQPICAW